MVLTKHRGGTPQSTLQVLSVPAYIRKKALNPRRKIECTSGWMMGKSDVQFGIWFSTWNVRSMLGKWGEISEILKDVLIFAVCRKWGVKEKGLKWLEMVLYIFWNGGCKAENDVGVIDVNWLIGKVVGAIGLMTDRWMAILLLGI